MFQMHEMTLGFLKTAVDNVPAHLAFAALTLPFCSARQGSIQQSLGHRRGTDVLKRKAVCFRS